MSLIVASLYKITKNNNFKSSGVIFLAVFIFTINHQKQIGANLNNFTEVFKGVLVSSPLLALFIMVQTVNYLNSEFHSKSLKNITSIGLNKCNYIVSVFFSNLVYSICLALIFHFIGFIIYKIMFPQSFIFSQVDLYEISKKIAYTFICILIYPSAITMLFFIFKNKTIATAIPFFMFLFEIFSESKIIPMAIIIKILTTETTPLNIIFYPTIIIALTIIITSIVFTKRDIEFYI